MKNIMASGYLLFFLKGFDNQLFIFSTIDEKHDVYMDILF